jgi:CRP/FNR family transcriptional regulator
MSEISVLYPALDLSDPELAAALDAAAVEVRVPAGTVVFEAADFCRVYPLILEGTARVVKIGARPRDTLLYRLRAGEHCLLTAAGLLARWRFGARVTAETDLRAVVLPATLFRRLVREVPEFALSIYVAIARRLEVVLDLVEQATYFRLDQRVASLLLGGGQRMDVSHQELADDLGASRENVSRVLEAFKAKGWITLGRRSIEVANPSALEAFVDE